MSEDRKLLAEVLSRIAENRQISPSRVRVAVENGVVWLSGEIGTAQQKAAAEHTAQSIPGVRRVINNLIVGKSWVEALAGALGHDGWATKSNPFVELDAQNVRGGRDGKLWH